MSKIFALAIVGTSFMNFALAELTGPKEKAVSSFFNALNASSLELVDAFYDEKVIFEDPVTRLEGRYEVKHYYKHLYRDVDYIHFEFYDQVTEAYTHATSWKTLVRPKRLEGGKEIVVSGGSFFRFSPQTNQVIYHRDYYDMGEFIYERLPVVKNLIRFIKMQLLAEAEAKEMSNKKIPTKTELKKML